MEKIKITKITCTKKNLGADHVILEYMLEDSIIDGFSLEIPGSVQAPNENTFQKLSNFKDKKHLLILEKGFSEIIEILKRRYRNENLKFNKKWINFVIKPTDNAGLTLEEDDTKYKFILIHGGFGRDGLEEIADAWG